MKKEPANHNRVTRRNFLKRSAQAGALLGFPTLIPASALGRNGAIAPSERIAVGHVGCGKMGTILRRSFAGAADAQVVACCDVEAGRLADYKKYYTDVITSRGGKGGDGTVATYNDYHELLARDDIDAVIISTPNHWHANMTVDACRAGKDVYCEKPLTHTVAEGYIVMEAVQRYGRVLQTGSMQRSMREFRFAAEMVRNGRIGEVLAVNCSVGHGPSYVYDLIGEEQAIFDWDRWIGPSQYQPYSSVIAPKSIEEHWAGWRRYRDFGGGGQRDWGAHMYDIAQWGLARDGQAPVEVIPAEQGNPEKEFLTYLYEDGVVMQRRGITQFKGMGGGLEFIGTKGAIFVNRGTLETNPQSLKSQPTTTNEEALYFSTNHTRDFLDCIKTRQKPITNEIVGAGTSIICELGNIADHLGQSFKWDHVRGLTDNDAANRYLNPPKRAGYTI